MKEQVRRNTPSVRTQAKRSLYKEHSTSIYETSAFVFDSAEEAQAVFSEEAEGYCYTRNGNPNTDEFIRKMCILESAEDGIATASGMAAISTAMMALLRPGDHVLAPMQMFGTTRLLFTDLLARWGVSHSLVDVNHKEEWEDNIMPNTRMIFAETPANPGLEITDLKWLAKLAQKYELYLVADNSFATPCLQNPLECGADLVIHSTTKFIDGQGRTLGGAALGNKDIIQELRNVLKISGPNMAPHTAWMLSKSLETLSVRMERHCENALKLAAFLEKNPEVLWIRYPFLASHPQYKLAKKQMKAGGGLVAFELKGGMKRAMRFINALKLVSIASNLGDTRTIITHPATTTHSRLTADERKESGVTDGMVRLSVGLESVDDLINDFAQAIATSKK
jgi:O-succinylhomoserine sulfhydrylase